MSLSDLERLFDEKEKTVQSTKYYDQGFWCAPDMFRKNYHRDYKYNHPFTVEEFDELLSINYEKASALLVNQYLYDVDINTPFRSQLFDVIPDKWKDIVCNQIGISKEEMTIVVSHTHKQIIQVPLLLFGCGNTFAYEESQKKGKKIYD